MERIPITKEGYNTLKEELERLKRVERPKNIKAIEEARAHGDLSENAEFHAAKERQSFLSGRIEDLEYKLASADIIDTGQLPKDRAVFGCRVLLENVDTGEESEYQLVGPDESDAKNGRISIVSPLGKSAIGKKPLEELTRHVPNGKRCYVIVALRQVVLQSSTG